MIPDSRINSEASLRPQFTEGLSYTVSDLGLQLI